MPTSKIPNTTKISEWAFALKWHPDLARDLRDCRSMIAVERRYKRAWEKMRDNWVPIQWWMWPGKPTMGLPSSQDLPVLMTAAWLHQRYESLWTKAPRLPDGVLPNALHVAVQAGAWTSAAELIGLAVAREVEIHARTDQAGRTFRVGWVVADVFDDVGDVQAPEWSIRRKNHSKTQALFDRGAWPEDIPRYPAIVLTVPPDGTLPQALEAVKAAWKDIEPALNQKIGTHQGQTRGRFSEYMEYVTLYRLYRQWLDQHIARGEETSQRAFTIAMSERRLPIQQRASRLHAAKNGPLSARLAYLINSSPGAQNNIADKLRDKVLPLLAPNKSVQSLRDFMRGV